jgi:hypothetical protein
MIHKKIIALSMALILLVSLFGMASAQGDTGDETTPPTVVVPSTTGAKFFTHPVVKLLSAYFDQASEDEVVVPVDPNTPTTDPVDGVTPPVMNESGLGLVGEEIAAYHEAGMGFGTLVKIYAMVKESEENCQTVSSGTPVVVEPPVEGAPVQEACTPLTAAELVEKFQSGVGMGQLFQEYGKPVMHGVGHVKQEKKNQDAQTTDGTELAPDNDATEKGNGRDQGKKPDKEKEKSNNGKGKGKDK